MPLLNVQQNSPEWLQLRIGNCTASRVKDALDRLKNGQPSMRRKNYLTELVSERLTGFAAEHYVSPAMEHGIETERYARAAYEVVSGNDVELVGIATHPSIKRFSASPDGLLGKDGLLEIKCPTTTTHLEWMMDGIFPEEHLFQCFSQMCCAERQFLDFISFDPRLPARHQVFICRLERDEKAIAALEFGVVEFLAEVDAKVEALEKMHPQQVDGEPPPDDGLGISDLDLPVWYQQLKESVAND